MWIKTLLRILLLLLLPLLLSIPSIVYLFNNSLVIFPNQGYRNHIGSTTNPHSSIEDFRVDSHRITLSYILREEPGGFPTPFSSIVVWLLRENSFFDLSGYNYLSLEIEKATAGKVVIFIKTFVQGISKPEKHEGHTLRHNEYTLSLTEGVYGYKIYIKDFFTPEWWFTLMSVPWDKRTKETYTKVSALDFQFIHRSPNPPEENKESFIITKITFHKSYPVFNIVLNIAAALYCIALVTAVLTNKKKIISLIKEYKEPPAKEIHYKHLRIENYAEKEFARVINYLKEHYSNPAISSSLISSETGIPRSHISEIIKNRYNCTCKQFINRIRITEAKRLLKSTDRRILEIALEVGFNDISTFNRCFKQAEGITPRQYRSGGSLPS